VTAAGRLITVGRAAVGDTNVQCHWGSAPSMHVLDLLSFLM
jgi:hypothetical protein